MKTRNDRKRRFQYALTHGKKKAGRNGVEAPAHPGERLDRDSLTVSTASNLEEQLDSKLLSIGGIRVSRYGPEPHLEILLEHGNVFTLPVRLRRGAPQECHRNAAELWAKDVTRRVLVTGYALNAGAWVAHSWVVQNKTLIETTMQHECYFGAALDPSSALHFCMVNYLMRDLPFLRSDKFARTHAGLLSLLKRTVSGPAEPFAPQPEHLRRLAETSARDSQEAALQPFKKTMRRVHVKYPAQHRTNVEYLWTWQTARDTAEVRNIPFFNDKVGLEDLVRVSVAGEVLEVLQRRSRTRHCSFTALAGKEEAQRQWHAVRQHLAKSALVCEHAMQGYFSIAVPLDFDESRLIRVCDECPVPLTLVPGASVSGFSREFAASFGPDRIAAIQHMREIDSSTPV